jgi:hypothetical protein
MDTNENKKRKIKCKNAPLTWMILSRNSYPLTPASTSVEPKEASMLFTTTCKTIKCKRNEYM